MSTSRLLTLLSGNPPLESLRENSTAVAVYATAFVVILLVLGSFADAGTSAGQVPVAQQPGPTTHLAEHN